MSDHHNPDADTVDGYNAADLRNGFDFVQDPEPSNPEVGDEWYATGGGSFNEGAYARTNSGTWTEQTINDHSKLSGLTKDAHHKPVPVPAVKDISTLQVDGNAVKSDNPSTQAVSPDGSFVSVGLSASIDVTNVAFLRFDVNVRNASGSNNYKVRAYDSANGLDSQSQNHSNTSFQWFSGGRVDVQALSGTLTFDFQMANQSSYGDTLEFTAWNIHREARLQ